MRNFYLKLVCLALIAASLVAAPVALASDCYAGGYNYGYNYSYGYSSVPYGYTWYADSVYCGKFYPAGYYTKLYGTWYRYGYGYEYGRPLAVTSYAAHVVNLVPLAPVAAPAPAVQYQAPMQSSAQLSPEAVKVLEAFAAQLQAQANAK